nr:unnamed protein product [Callosobruchus chinensis]
MASEMDIEHLMKKRGVLKGKLTHFEKYIDTLESDIASNTVIDKIRLTELQQRTERSQADLLETLEHNSQSYSTLAEKQDKNRSNSKPKYSRGLASQTSQENSTNLHCPFCKGNHNIFYCAQGNHEVKDCRFGNCRICNSKHNSILHDSQQTQSTTVQLAVSPVEQDDAHIDKAIAEPTTILDQDIIDFERFSSLIRLKRSFAYLARFINNCRKPKSERLHGNLTTSEINDAFHTLIRVSQVSSFPSDYQRLKDGNNLSSSSSLLSLSPFMDKDGLLRVGGRLKYSNLPYSRKHPILLNSSHHLTKLKTEISVILAITTELELKKQSYSYVFIFLLVKELSGRIFSDMSQGKRPRIGSSRNPNKLMEWCNELKEEIDLEENKSKSETDDYVYESQHDTNSEHEADAVNLEDEDEGMSGDDNLNVYLAKDGVSQWRNKHLPLNVRTRACNIITHFPGGLKGKARKASSKIES